MSTDKTIVPNFGGGDLCGTETTPQCPLQAVYLARNALIYQIAGTRTDRERVRMAAERVDEYLVGVLRSALELTLPLNRQHSPTT
ncbi:MAG TPA: hypothetical protein VHW23_41110 [Kofleriaceae bacterium]|jgi:hypothetical protein|nr:hypothetical protein [Kofleriaceae bacterium]